ncbi:MAG: hypothetical protein A2268_00605 [Candidatus Raymondbacteria bacterium RifOxyA12_full_50_37]|uniref:Uncharacterized protein n=1 Tax=Candidatus Raymondbacteria bacterium RIFOXYD12_FULL_49_13 TaxID=1817890 RepID=A0A1F7F1F2_UNCRA|nr:MAG: hypothetical protein A2350_20380 [Candidatus Raymondbacteria bacterium RifOxyB12_full_50_8]OGJ90657.1 MAG: hypothetical protein A2268_00605 [Candidatus Raymondbacteria bacterium RifOxyA12_full_50_37]OGJ92000.1 MAG: hypothetical protein A2248_15665 [Candidatus Raymondbacteria bacterium RIFOXYA2_FULL_49_16]OGK00393.1 MAG: hypothetical protein A2519_01160 [Candidatus Raymondbacteria bacterium RIFOXYD12_FULL_49_13]OGK05408.1 MAG: hypothetical protein A2487_11620 [Candidatus Raymondbacteria 
MLGNGASELGKADPIAPNPSRFLWKKLFHALLTRKYVKGRDWYDFQWYLTKFRDLEPNFAMLNNALQQTGWTSGEINNANWKERVRHVIAALDMKKIRDDVFRFLEDEREADLLTKENLLRLVS